MGSAAEANDATKQLLEQRCRGRVVNAVGDLLQGKEERAVLELRKLESLAFFVANTSDLEMPSRSSWNVTPRMCRRLVQAYTNSKAAGGGIDEGAQLLEEILGLS